MSNTKYDMVIVQGETFHRKFTYLKDNSLVDLTDAEIRMQIRSSVESDSVLADYALGSGFELGNGVGEFELIVDADGTSAMTFPRGVYDLEIEFPNGEVIKILYGSITLRKEVTR